MVCAMKKLTWEGIKEPDRKMLSGGFDHPCRQTCSGWEQGRMRGVFDLQEKFDTIKSNFHIVQRYHGGDGSILRQDVADALLNISQALK
jgi:hypothetical protein